MEKEKIIKKILKPRIQEKDFHGLINCFEEKIERAKTIYSPIKINNYFGKGMGKKTAMKKLIDEGLVEKEWINFDNNDFKGLYIFFNEKKPFYVGISKGIVTRIIQHIKGRDHYSATLAYNIGLLDYEFSNDNSYFGERNKFDFNKYVEPAKDFLLDQNIGFIHINNDDELYVFEIYCSMKFRTILNKFETH